MLPHLVYMLISATPRAPSSENSRRRTYPCALLPNPSRPMSRTADMKPTMVASSGAKP
uniref:Uncharacterized protein n=1 Tax=Arundo donax TaxID=35708 RepID=A0A0A9GHF7_ARUDO